MFWGQISKTPLFQCTCCLRGDLTGRLQGISSLQGCTRAVARLYNILYVLQIGQHLACIGGGLTWVRSIVCHRLQSIRSIQTLDRIHDFYEEVGTIIRVQPGKLKFPEESYTQTVQRVGNGIYLLGWNWEFPDKGKHLIKFHKANCFLDEIRIECQITRFCLGIHCILVNVQIRGFFDKSFSKNFNKINFYFDNFINELQRDMFDILLVKIIYHLLTYKCQFMTFCLNLSSEFVLQFFTLCTFYKNY